ncbi:MAG TPA: signal recognition particle-docking protein FtsY [Terriglobales bacterium]|nr:signal recognition particle-docking protein FtsY [Terriglobales bacterium]
MIQTLFGEPPKATVFERLQEKMTGAARKTRDNVAGRLEDLFKGRAEVSEADLKQLEAALIGADIGARTAAEIVARVRQAAEERRETDLASVRRAIEDELVGILERATRRPRQVPDGEPLVLMLVGVNGTGKTTTIGKLTQYYRAQGRTVLLCAADTFRAAATEQLQAWGQRTGAEVIHQKPGADPSAVLYDALAAAKARKSDFVIVDTAGRLHTKSNLMQELAKMRRTAGRLIPGAPHEVLLVLDATTGQNGLQQARQFAQAADVTGLIVTKLDGTARGGIVIAIARELGLPVRYVGTGEQADDFVPFEPRRFVEAIVGAA